MPRINWEATHALRAQQANVAYIEEHFPRAAVNDGWAVDYIDKIYCSKVYGFGTVTTSMEPPYTSIYQEFT